MKHIAWLLVLGSAWLTQCTTPESKKQLAQIKALETRVDSCQNVLKVIAFDSVQKHYAHIKVQLAAIQAVLPENQTFEESQYLGMYYDNSKTFKKITKGFEPLMAEIAITETQLANLKHDVKHNLVADTNFSPFYHNEKRAVDAIVFETKNFIYWQEKGMKRYQGMRTKVDSILTSYSQLN